MSLFMLCAKLDVDNDADVTSSRDGGTMLINVYRDIPFLLRKGATVHLFPSTEKIFAWREFDQEVRDTKL